MKGRWPKRELLTKPMAADPVSSYLHDPHSMASSGNSIMTLTKVSAHCYPGEAIGLADGAANDSTGRSTTAPQTEHQQGGAKAVNRRETWPRQGAAHVTMNGDIVPAMIRQIAGNRIMLHPKWLPHPRRQEKPAPTEVRLPPRRVLNRGAPRAKGRLHGQAIKLLTLSPRVAPAGGS